MKITREQVLAMGPCSGFKAWYVDNNETDAEKLLLRVNEEDPSWARWGFSRAMNHRQRVRITVYAAELVIAVYEELDGSSRAPVLAIEAARAWLDNPTSGAAYAADAAAHAAAGAAADAAAYAAAYAAADAAHAAAGAAADAAYAAGAAAGAAADAADAADAARIGTQKEIQEKIIKEAIRILEEPQ